MNAEQSSSHDYATTLAWRAAAIAFVLIYCPLLALVIATTSFSEEEAARQYITRTMTRPPAPLPPLPVMHVEPWPDVAMQRDPFQP